MATPLIGGEQGGLFWRSPLKMWAGWPMYRMVIVARQLIGGDFDLKKLLAEKAI